MPAWSFLSASIIMIRPAPGTTPRISLRRVARSGLIGTLSANHRSWYQCQIDQPFASKKAVIAFLFSALMIAESVTIMSRRFVIALAAPPLAPLEPVKAYRQGFLPQ